MPAALGRRTIEYATTSLAAAVAFGCLSQSTPALRTHVELPDAGTRVAEFLADHSVAFTPGGVELQAASFATLDSLAHLVAGAPEVALAIEAYATTQPDELYNLELSEYRAETVRVYLALRGAPIERLRARGYGNPRSIDGGAAADGPDTYPDVVFRLEQR